MALFTGSAVPAVRHYLGGHYPRGAGNKSSQKFPNQMFTVWGGNLIPAIVISLV